MFVKLFKYEWRAIAHTMFPLYLVALVIAAVNGFMMFLRGEYAGNSMGIPIEINLDNGFMDLVQGIILMLYFSMMVALFVVAFVVIVQRFYKGILGDEGYLILTAPVKMWQIPAAKCLVALAISVLTGVVVVLQIFLIANPLELIRDLMQVDWVGMIAAANAQVPLWWLYALEMLVVTVVGMAASFYQIYLAIMLGQLSNTHKLAFSFLWYIAINVALSMVSRCAMLAFGYGFSFWENLMTVTVEQGVQLIILVSGVAGLIQLLIFGAGTQYLMTKKLNV